MNIKAVVYAEVIAKVAEYGRCRYFKTHTLYALLSWQGLSQERGIKEIFCSYYSSYLR